VPPTLLFDRRAYGPEKLSSVTQKDFCNTICHVWTAPGWQEKSSRRGLGRCSHVFGLLERGHMMLATIPSADQVSGNFDCVS
jgi:hypothetical protein